MLKLSFMLSERKTVVNCSESKWSLEYTISENGVQIDKNNIEAISKMERPKSKKELQSFLNVLAA